MQHVIGADEPAAVELFKGAGGGNFARIRKNIEDDWRDVPEDSAAQPQHFWEWDEVIIETDLTAEEIEANADQLWYEAERSGMSDAEWRADVDSALLDLMELAVG